MRKLCSIAVNLAETVSVEKKETEKHGGFLELYHLARKLDMGRTYAHSAVRHAYLHDAATGFIQKKTFTGIRLSVTKDPDSPGDVSQFQALTTALASTIGTGNIIGVGTAIYLGGPGAVLWCWLTGVFGHRDQVRGEPDRGQVPRADRRRPHDGRRDVCT